MHEENGKTEKGSQKYLLYVKYLSTQLNKILQIIIEKN